MINNIRNIQIFKPDELGNDEYHGEKWAGYSSGSELWAVYHSCAAEVKYGEKKESAALHFGTASHSAILEPEVFESQFVRGLDPDDFELKTDAAIKSKLKEMGVKGYSNKSGFDLISLLLQCDPDVMPLSLAQTIQDVECKLDGKTIVKHSDYDQIKVMRDTLFNYPSYAELLNGSTNELSIFAEIQIGDKWYKVKCRPDAITKDKQVPDYKTTRSIEPEFFGRQAHDAGYYLKMAFTLDIVNAALGSGHKASLLAQSKTAPYLAQKYNLTENQLNIGRDQYEMALMSWQQCKDNETYPAYFDGEVDLFTPEWVKKIYNIEE